MKTQTVLKLEEPTAHINLDYKIIGYKVYLSFSADGIQQVKHRPALHTMTVFEAEELVHKIQSAINDAKKHNERLGKK